MGIIGRHSFELCSRPRIISSASYVGDKEGKGPLRECFDKICRDDTLGLDSWEQAESRMFESAVRVALAKIKRQSDDLSCLLGGDLLNQIISSGFAAREIRAPFIGLYGACSTISEGLMLGGMLVDGGFAELAACAASSHFSAAERQFRYPLEMGVQAVPSSQRTVTGAGSIIIQAAGEFRPGAGNVFEHVALTGGTIGRVEDYDRIITGDLGIFGSDMLYELLRGEGIEIADRHEDCGKLMFSPEQNVNCGASGCGCAATVMSSWFLPKIESGKIRRVLFLATGALMSPVSSLQGESIPSIAHAVVIEHID